MFFQHEIYLLKRMEDQGLAGVRHTDGAVARRAVLGRSVRRHPVRRIAAVLRSKSPSVEPGARPDAAQHFPCRETRAGAYPSPT